MRLTIVLDCADPESLAAFWAEALGYRRAAWPHEPYVILAPAEEGHPLFILQRVPEPKAAKNRMHVDLTAADIEAEAERLTAIGAKRLSDGPVEEHGVRWIVMADPEGNEFCVCSG